MDVRRGGSSRFSSSKRQASKKSGPGMEDRDDKLKRERTKKLSFLSKQSNSSGGETESMMMVNCGGGGSDGEEQLRPTMSISKRFNLPKKLAHDCKTVDHSSVPRKLRSAMKRRGFESPSPPRSTRKKPNLGINRVESAGKDTRTNGKEDWLDDLEVSPSRSVVGPITKDEEEVVETLSALAEMFPVNDNMNKVDSEVAKAKPSICSEKESSNPDIEAPGIEKDMNTSCALHTSEAAKAVLSAEETLEEKCSNELLGIGSPSRSDLLKELDISIFQRKPHVMSLLSESEPVSRKPSCSHSRLSLREMQSQHLESSLYAGKPEIGVGRIASFSGHELETKDSTKRAEGPVLWPGLSSAGSHRAAIQGPSFKSSTKKVPSWLGMSPAATQPGSGENGLTTGKNYGPSASGKKSWKRCSAHIYICRLIKVLEIGENKDRPSLHQSTPDLELNSLLAGKSRNGVRNDLNGDVSAADKNPNEVRNAILLQKRLFQDHHQQASTSSALCTSHNKGFDFLSLSAGGGSGGGGGGGGLGAPHRGNDKAANGLELLTQFQNPYLQSVGRNNSIMPLYLSQSQFSSPPSTDHHPAAASKQVRLQPNPYQYLGSPLIAASYLGNTDSQKQQQQRNWTAQMAAQYRQMGLPQSHNWKNGRQDPTSSSSSPQYGNSGAQLLHSSLEALGPKYAAPCFHQNVATAGSSSPAHGGAKRQFYLPSGVLHPYSDPPIPLQLLCNDQL